MRNLSVLLCCLLLSTSLSFCQGERQTKPHVLFITGGHDYDETGFAELLSKLPITYNHVRHPNAYRMLKSDSIAAYDAVLLYDMPKEIPTEAQNDFIEMLNRGKGLVVLHHSFCSYDHWPEYKVIIGGRFHHFPWMKDGVEQARSTFKIGVPLNIKVEDTKHPITVGISDFQIIDEAYKITEILPGVHPLLSTDNPLSEPLIGWTKQYGKSRIVTFTLGHDERAWEHPAFIQILSRSLLWVTEDSN